jgi:hypothetical protein
VLSTAQGGVTELVSIAFTSLNAACSSGRLQTAATINLNCLFRAYCATSLSNCCTHEADRLMIRFCRYSDCSRSTCLVLPKAWLSRVVASQARKVQDCDVAHSAAAHPHGEHLLTTCTRTADTRRLELGRQNVTLMVAYLNPLMLAICRLISEGSPTVETFRTSPLGRWIDTSYSILDGSCLKMYCTCVGQPRLRDEDSAQLKETHVCVLVPGSVCRFAGHDNRP